MAAGPMAIGLAIAPTVLAATTTNEIRHVKTTKAKPKPIKGTCSIAVSTATAGDAGGAPTVAQQGLQYGSVGCSKELGRGVQADSFTTSPSGDLTGSLKQYFNTGSIHGTYVLTATDGQPSSTFTSISYTGVLTVMGGTGDYRQAKGAGTLTCSSADGMHLTCSETFKVKLPIMVTARTR